MEPLYRKEKRAGLEWEEWRNIFHIGTANAPPAREDNGETCWRAKKVAVKAQPSRRSSKLKESTTRIGDWFCQNGSFKKKGFIWSKHEGGRGLNKMKKTTRHGNPPEWDTIDEAPHERAQCPYKAQKNKPFRKGLERKQNWATKSLGEGPKKKKKHKEKRKNKSETKKHLQKKKKHQMGQEQREKSNKLSGGENI